MTGACAIAYSPTMASVAVLFRITDEALAKRFLAYIARSKAGGPGVVSKSSAGLYLMERGLCLEEDAATGRETPRHPAMSHNVSHETPGGDRE